MTGPLAWWRRTSLRTRLGLSIAVAILSAVAGSLGIAGLLVRASVRDEARSSLERQVALLSRAGVRQQAGEATQASGRQNEQLLVLDGLAAAALFPERKTDIEAGRPASGSTSSGGREFLFATAPVGDNTIILYRASRLALRPFALAMIAAGAVGALLAGIVALLLSRAIARPVQRVADASRELADGRLPEPLPEIGPREVRSLAGSFNHMASELERARHAERAFLLSVSHELKTPLTVIRGNAEALEEGVVSPEAASVAITRETGRLQRLVQDLLDLARLSVRVFAVRSEPVDLADLASEVLQRYRRTAADFGVTLSTESHGGGTVQADHDRLLQVISNLVENALRITPAGGSVTIDTSPDQMSVRDTGPGLSGDDIARAFERFVLYERYGKERKVGSGLGLAIVKELTEAMGGSVTVESRPGSGTRFRVRLRSSATDDQPTEAPRQPVELSQGHRET